MEHDSLVYISSFTVNIYLFWRVLRVGECPRYNVDCAKLLDLIETYSIYREDERGCCLPWQKQSILDCRGQWRVLDKNEYWGKYLWHLLSLCEGLGSTNISTACSDVYSASRRLVNTYFFNLMIVIFVDHETTCVGE